MSRYIDENSVVDAVGLRQYVFDQLVQLKKTAEVVCVEKQIFWDKVKLLVTTELYDEEREKATIVLNQLTHLPHYIQMWVETSVDTSERFDFFVMTKAHELMSGDQSKDYFWALQIRHDQLMALVQVLTLLIGQMKMWVKKDANKLLDDPIFSGLTDMGIEDQVYLEAEKIYKERGHGRD